MSEKPGGALSRWSQRKHAARVAARGSAAPAALRDADEPVVSELQPQPAPDAPAQLPSDVRSTTEREAEERTAESCRPLPPIEELTAESDYTQFLAEHVPEALQRAALRKLWTSDPVLACLDGLNDYDEDYNVIDTVISVADTDYKVGRGFLEADEPESDRAPGQVATATGEAEPAPAPSEGVSESKMSPDDPAQGQGYSPDSIDEEGARPLVADRPEGPASDLSPDNTQRSKG